MTYPLPRARTSRWLSAAGLVMGFAACNADPEPGGISLVPHCADAGGNATCVSNYPNRPWCSLCADQAVNQGCVQNEPVPQCSPGGGIFPDTTSADSGVDPSTTSGSTDDGSATVSVDETTIALDDTGSTGDFSCEGSGYDVACADRDGTAPYCDEGTCVSCMDAGGDQYCNAIGDETPACDTARGLCVACDGVMRSVCTGQSPICGATGACEACTEHEQCPDTACHLSPNDSLVGACFETSEVIWVDSTAVCPGMGTQASPSCSLQGTLSGLGPGDVHVIKLVHNGTPITQQVTASGDITVAIVGQNGVPTFSGNPGSPGGAFVAGGSSLLYLHRLRFNDNPLSHGISCSGSEVWLTGSEIADNAGWGIFDTGPCTLNLRRSTLHHNTLGGVRVVGGALTLDNAAVAINGNGSAGPAVELQFGTLKFLYSTIVGNDGVSSDSLTCNQATGEIRNSIVQGVDPFSISLDCFMLDMEYNALDNSNFANGTNQQVPLYNEVQFVDPDAGDFRLQAPPLSPYGDTALWVEGDPIFDADGSERPLDGSLGYAGIDEPG